jgi:hypothetical protein
MLDRLRVFRWCEEPTRCSSVAKPRLSELMHDNTVARERRIVMTHNVSKLDGNKGLT